MRSLVEGAKRQDQFRRFVLGVVDGVRGRGFDDEIETVAEWVRDHITYRRDPYGVETFHTPLRLAKDARDGLAAGDCDDQALMAAAMLETLGHRTRFRVGGGARGWSHIWLEVYSGGSWVPIELTMERDVGWDPALRFERTTTFGGEPMPILFQETAPGGDVSQTKMITTAGGYHRLLPSDFHRMRVVSGGGVTAADMHAQGDLAGWGKSFRRFTKRIRKTWRSASRGFGEALPFAQMAANFIPGLGPIASMGIGAAGSLFGGDSKSAIGGILGMTGLSAPIGNFAGQALSFAKPFMDVVNTGFGAFGGPQRPWMPGLEAGFPFSVPGLLGPPEDLGALPAGAMRRIAQAPDPEKKFALGKWLWSLRPATKNYFDPRPILNLKVPPEVVTQYHEDPAKSQKWFKYDWGPNPTLQPGAQLVEALSVLAGNRPKWASGDPGFRARAENFYQTLEMAFNRAFAIQMKKAQILAQRDAMKKARKKAEEAAKKRKRLQLPKKRQGWQPGRGAGPKVGGGPGGIEDRYRRALEEMRKKMAQASGGMRKRYEARIKQLEDMLRRMAQQRGGRPASSGLSPALVVGGIAALALAMRK